MSPALPRPVSPTFAFIDNLSGEGFDVAGPVTRGIGAGLAAGGAALVHVFRALQEQAASWQRTETTIAERPRACGAIDSARAYLNNLQRDGLDQALRSIPARTYDWKLPTGHGVEVRQVVGKDGLTFVVNIKEPGGKSYRLQHVHAEITEKGIKVPVGRVPLRLGNQTLGELDVALRVGATGLNEVTLKFTGSDGRILTLKLKTAPCNPDITGASLVRPNVGSSPDARYFGEQHLARSASARRGNLHEGMTDLLMQIQPSANGLYRNHGSSAMDLVARPLELLRAAGADFSAFQALQDTYARLPRRPNGRPLDEDAFRDLRQQTWAWLQRSLQQSIDRGSIRADDLANRFGVNYGVDAVRDGYSKSAAPPVARQRPQANAYAVGEGIGTPFGRVVWAGVSAAGTAQVAQVKTRTTPYDLPSSVNPANRDEVRAWVLRSVQHGHIPAAHLYGASQARYLNGERIGTPHGDLFYVARGASGGPEVRGRNKSYEIKDGIDLTNRDAVRGWAIRAIENGQIDRAQLHGPVSASGPAASADQAWPTKVRANWRQVQQAVRSRGWEVSQMPDGEFFVWRVAGNSAAREVTNAIADVLDVPRDRMHVATTSYNVLGQKRSGLAVSARVYAD